MTNEIKKITWKYKKFEELNINELYDILNLRNETFVFQQKAIYNDTDYKDQEALHLFGTMDDKIVVYCRIFDRDVKYKNLSSIGRVIVSPEHRRKEIGRELVGKAVCFLKAKNQLPIKIEAQAYLERFYESFGFKTISDVYELECLPHIDMICEK